MNSQTQMQKLREQVILMVNAFEHLELVLLLLSELENWFSDLERVLAKSSSQSEITEGHPEVPQC